MLKDKEMYDEIWSKYENHDDFIKFCKEGGWGSPDGFFESTGFEYDELKNTWFHVCNNRVFIDDMRDEEYQKVYCI